ncbi:MAG TPA: hypothetical protein VGN56_02015 [Candidatus Paceibacterota bacterium]|jgi:hypothetical protein|nr:hypothetical protein [Candidatus Paceibacterota bacterium]
MNDGAFILAFFLFFFAAWVASGGPTKPISFAGPYITPITTVGTTQTGYGTLPSGGAGASISATRSTLSNIQQSVAGLNKEVQEAQLFGEASPYKGDVTISWGNSFGSSDPKQEYITIRASHDAPDNITISGWKLVRVSNDTTVTIPQGQKIFSPTSTATAPIVLHPDDTAIINSGKSPIDESFEENECMGYYTKGEQFNPGLSQSCPYPYDDFVAHYPTNSYKDDTCYNLLKNTYSCTIPIETSSLSSNCYNFIDQYLNYPGCVANHRTDQDFSGNTWRIFLNRDIIQGHDTDTRYYGPVWKQTHDAIKLEDQNGKTVDLYEY